eukprot:1554284-Rhodomonas_salina.1
MNTVELEHHDHVCVIVVVGIQVPSTSESRSFKLVLALSHESAMPCDDDDATDDHDDAAASFFHTYCLSESRSRLDWVPTGSLSTQGTFKFPAPRLEKCHTTRRPGVLWALPLPTTPSTS